MVTELAKYYIPKNKTFRVIGMIFGISLILIGVLGPIFQKPKSPSIDEFLALQKENIRLNKKAAKAVSKIQTSETFHVTSKNQSGGVTAGKIDSLTVSNPPITISQKDFEVLNIFAEKCMNKAVEITVYSGGNQELANAIRAYLISKGLEANFSGRMMVFNPVPKGVSMNSDMSICQVNVGAT